MLRACRLIFALWVFTRLACGALPDYTLVWEVHQAGADSNGGCFVSGGTGTDYTQQDSPQFSLSDLIIDGTTNTKVTSTSHNFVSTDVDNCIHIISGTGFTAGWFRIVSTASNAATLDRSAGTLSSTGGVWKEGGALGTVGQLSTNMAITRGATGWVKADATYSVSSMITLLFSGSNDGWPTITGYTSTRGDGGMVTMQAAAGLAGSDNSIFRFNTSPNGIVVANFILDCNNQTFTGGLESQTNYETGRNLWAKNCSSWGFRADNPFTCDRCTTTNTPATGISGRNHAFYANNVSFNCFDCAALGTTQNNVIAFDVCGGTYINTIIANFTGTTSDGLSCVTQEGDGLLFINGSVYNITRDAFRYGENTAIDTRPLLIRNVVMSNIGGYCFNDTGSLAFKTSAQQTDHNACNPTGSGFYNNWPAGVGDITLSANPFTNGGSNDFSLNNTAGGGASAKAAGFPGVLNSGGTGYIDLGALQSQATGGSAGTIVHGYSQ